MRLLYGEHRSALVECIGKEFGSTLPILGAEAGMHLAVILPKGIRDTEIAHGDSESERHSKRFDPSLGSGPEDRTVEPQARRDA
jgi:hypothetical protein